MKNSSNTNLSGESDQPFYIPPAAAHVAFERLTSAIEKREFLALALVGRAGVGKSALLFYLLRQSSILGHIAVIINGQRISGFNDLIGQIAHSLSKAASGQVTGLDDILQRHITDAAGMLLGALQEAGEFLPPNFAIIVALDDLPVDILNNRQFIDFVRELKSRKLSHVKFIITAQALSLVNSAIARLFVIIEIEPLTDEELRELVRLRLKGSDVPEEVVVRLAEISERLIDFSAGNRSSVASLISGIEDTSMERLVRKAENSFSSPATVKLVLRLIAVFTNEDVAFVRELAGFNEKQLQDIFAHLTPLFMLGGSAPALERQVLLVHGALRDYIMNDICTEAKLSTATLQFGAEEAERDTRLPDQMMECSWLDVLAGGEKSIVLGDRGSGKSAIFRFFTEKNGSWRTARKVQLAIAPDKNPAAFVSLMLKGDGASAETFKAVWMSFAAAHVSKYLITEGSATSDDTDLMRQARLVAKGAGILDHAITPVGPWKRFANRLKPFRETKITFKLGPITIEPAGGSVAGWFNKQPIDIEEFLLQADRELDSRVSNVRVMVDCIDAVFKYDPHSQEPLVQGLFLAEARLSILKRIAFILLLRTDIFERYDIQEKNKLQSRTVLLDWSETDIVSMLIMRVFNNPSLSHIAMMLGIKPKQPGLHQEAALRLIFPEQVEGRSTADWLADSLTNGRGRIAPRAVILFLNALKDISTQRQKHNDFPIFEGIDMVDAMTRLSELCYDEVINDFRAAPFFMRSCRTGRVTNFRMDNIAGLMKAEEGSIPQQIELLERLGVIKRIVSAGVGGAFDTSFTFPLLYSRCWITTPNRD